MSTPSPTAATKFGPVQGVAKVTADGKEYASFQGVPYAEQPVGEFRFRDPRPLEPWEGTLDASKEGPVAFNYDLYSVVNKPFYGADECLTLNIYTPDLAPVKPLPVFVWIHGGGFVCGDGTTEYYGPDFIVEHDVIMVSLNYRLNVFGFLSFEDPKVGIPGNAGLKDQSMALRWVKENISDFGGDPENITIAGESAGSASCHYHLVSPLSKGLFNRAILLSASSLCPWASRIPGGANPERQLATLLGWNGEGGDFEVFEVLSQADPELLSQLSMDSILSNVDKCFGTAIFSPFLPTVEAYDNGGAFLPKSALELGRDPWSKDIDVIIGGLSHEGIMFYENLALMDVLKDNYKLLVPLEVTEASKLSKEEVTDKGEALKRAYFGDSEPSSDNEIFLDYFGDKLFWHGIHRAMVQRFRSGGKGKTYSYWLEGDADPDIEHFVLWRKLCSVPHFRGFNHGDELVLMFKSFYNQKPTEKSCVFNLFRQFLSVLMSFTKSGDPNDESIAPARWEPSEEDLENGFKCLVIKEEGSQFGTVPNWEKLRVWDEIYDKEDLLF